MCENNNLVLNKPEQRKEELEVALKWRIVPKLSPEVEYRITIAYTDISSKQENIKVLEFHKGADVHVKILNFFDKFLQNVNDFGLLAESRDKTEFYNWDISFSRKK